MLHPEAIKKFNKKAEEVVGLVGEQQLQKYQKVNNLKGRYISHRINKKDIIGEIKLSVTNIFGDDLGFLFQIDHKEYGITEADYKDLIKCVEKIQKDKSYCEILSVSFILEKFKKWIINRYQKKEERDFISFLEYNLNKAINKYQVWVPIPFTSTEKEFPIGNVMIRTISKNVIDLWISTDTNKVNAEMLSELETYKIKIRREYQGYAAAVYEYKAEPIRAQEIALDYISDALSILRLFSPSNFSTRLTSGIYEYGQSLIENKSIFLYDSDNLGFSQKSKSLNKGMSWTIPAHLYKWISDPSMAGFIKILLIKKRNDFQKKVYEALKIYSKHTLKRNPFDKLLYIIIALESILLKNETESITQNLSERVAFAITKKTDIDERKNIVKTIKYIYLIRSKFLHHGKQTIEEIEEINKFLTIAWRMFVVLTQNISNFETKDDFIKELEDLKFS